MKRIAAIALFTVAALGTATGALAQQPALRVTVPFDFTVGNKLLPAGQYSIHSSMPGIMVVQSTDNRYNTAIVTTHGNGESSDGSKVVFDVYGNQYFLHRILCPTFQSMNVDLPTSKLEKRVRSREAMLARGEQTLLASN